MLSNNLAYTTFFKGGLPFATIQDARITACFSDWSNYFHSPIFISSAWNNSVPEETTHIQRGEGRRERKGRNRERMPGRTHMGGKELDPQKCSFLKRYTFFCKFQVFGFLILMQNSVQVVWIDFFKQHWGCKRTVVESVCST